MNTQLQLKTQFASAIDCEAKKAVFSEMYNLSNDDLIKVAAFDVLVRINQIEQYRIIMDNLICSLDDAKKMAFDAILYYYKVLKFCSNYEKVS